MNIGPELVFHFFLCSISLQTKCGKHPHYWSIHGRFHFRCVDVWLKTQIKRPESQLGSLSKGTFWEDIDGIGNFRIILIFDRMISHMHDEIYMQVFVNSRRLTPSDLSWEVSSSFLMSGTLQKPIRISTRNLPFGNLTSRSRNKRGDYAAGFLS